MQLERQPLHEIIRRRRRFLDITQEELGAKVGIKKQHISNVETGKAAASMEVLEKIFDALDLEVKPRSGDWLS